jgi:hypothetical protein
MNFRNFRKTPAITLKPVRAIKKAITARIQNSATGETEVVVNTRGLIEAVSRERHIPRHSSIDRMLTGLSRPALERVLASVSA